MAELLKLLPFKLLSRAAKHGDAVASGDRMGAVLVGAGLYLLGTF